MEHKVVDWTAEFNLCSCPERDLALAIINKYFDVGQVPVSDDVKHYPLDDMAKSPEEKVIKFQEMNKIIWSTILAKIGTIDLTSDQKLGRMIYCQPNRFGFLPEKEDFKAYLFEFGDGMLQAEINFTVEKY